ncbi:MAG: hypothetical protein ACNI25_08815 [Halarcobacter sp.]
MEHIAIKDIKIKIDIIKILNIISSKKEFEIDIFGEINQDINSDIKKPIIYKYNKNDNKSLLLDAKNLASNIFKDYKPEINGSICVLNPINAWQEVISLNQSKMLYFDHQTDGIEIFEDDILEEYGWHCIPCDITYRDISEFIENNCDGILVFYDNDIQFNGFVIVDDIKDVREKVYLFIIKRLKKMLADDSLDLDDDEILESLEYFNIEV